MKPTEEDGRTVRLYSVCLRYLRELETSWSRRVYTHDVSIEMLCDRLNAPGEEKHNIDFGLDRKYFPSLEAANDFLKSWRESIK